jgi:hypothetical protein
MTRSSPTTLAVAADYADAMLVARRWKDVLFLLLSLILAAQLGVFFAARYTHSLPIRPGDVSGSETATRIAVFLEYLTDVEVFLGVLLPIVLAIVLLLIVTIMLVGRLVGVSHLTRAFCRAVILVCFLFPWQALLNTRAIRAISEVHAGVAVTTQPADVPAVPDVRVPGALYTWPELVRDYDFPNSDTRSAILHWARFVLYPVVMLILAMSIQVRGTRGLRLALGEAEVQTEVVT